MFKKRSPPKKALNEFTSVIIVLMMLLTVFSTVTAGSIFNRKDTDDDSLIDKIDTSSITSYISNKFSKIREKFGSLSDKIKQRLSGTDKSDNNVLTQSTNILESSSASFPLKFYTNYDGIEKTSNLRLFTETKIDIDGDSKNDIGAYLKIYPGVVSPISLAIIYKISIRQLSGFDDLDDDAYFKVMSQLTFPGLLSKNLTGDKLEFGYESPEGELIPENCDVTYKFVPHIFSLKKTPDHIFKIKPDSAAEGSAKLNLLFGYTESDDGAEVFSKVSYDPIVDSEITFKRSRDSGASFFEYERSISSETNVDLYLSYTKDENKTCAYALDLPDYVGFSLKIGPQGRAEFSTDSAISEIGLCDDIDNPKNKVYFSNMFTVARIEWVRDPFVFLTQGNINASVYTEGAGVSFNIHLEGDSGGSADFGIMPDATIINASLELDLSDGYLRLNRNEFDLFVSFSVSVLNESISSFLSTLEGSFNLVRLSDGPFEIYFDGLFDGDVEIYLSGKSFELSDVDITGFSETIGGNFSVLMDSFVKEINGFVSFALDVEKEGNNITGSCRFEIDKGAEIENLSLKFNNFVFARESISTSLSVVKYYPFSICVSIVEWNVSSDLSNGTIIVRSNSSAILSFNSTYSDGSEVVGRVSGTIQLKTTSDLFNITWETIDGNLSLNIDGAALIGLSDFYLWVKDKVEISIPEISINFEINTVGKDGSLMLYLDDNVVSANVNISDMNFTDLFGITLKGSIAVVLDAEASGTINIAWNESGRTSIDGDFEADATGSIDITNFEFNYKGLVDISMSRLFIDGGLNVDFSSIAGNMSLYADVDITDIVISDLSFYSSIVFTSLPLGISADMDITFDGTGFINIVYSNDTLAIDGAIYDDSEIIINSFWFLVPVIFMELNLESFCITGSTTILFNVEYPNDIPLSVTFYSDSEITADTIYAGLYPYLQIFIYDFIGGGSGGNIGIGFNMATSQPVFDLNHSSCYIGNLQLFAAGAHVPLSNLSLEGTAHLEGFLDIMGLTYVYLNGEIIEDTTISFKNMQIPILGSHNVSIVLKPGKLDLLLQLSLGTGDVYVYGYSSAWITVKFDDSEIVKLMGALDLGVHFEQSTDGVISVVINAKEASGAIIFMDKLRVVGELNALLEFSVKIVQDENSFTISDLYVNISGELFAVVQVKANETDWIPIYPDPYSGMTSGQVVIFRQAPLMTAPNIASNFEIITEEDNASLTFEVWYSPPLGKDAEEIGPYTYNVSFGDGTYYEVITEDTRIVAPSHLYDLGGYDVSVTVIPSDLTIDSVSDDLSFEITKRVTYVEIVEKGPTDFTYDDVEGDGRIHTWFKIGNKDDEDYILEWEAIVEQQESWLELEDADPTAEPGAGVLGPGETVIISVSILPPSDYKEHVFYAGANNTNYSGEGEDLQYFACGIGISLSVSPGAVYLPSLAPNASVTSSIWIWNNKKGEALNWTISGYPNDNYSFSSMAGSIPPGSAEIVHFTITAPGENGIDLGGEINVTDVDNPIFYKLVPVNVKTKGQGSTGDGNVTVKETPSGNVSIIIGGSNEIHINNFQFEVNGKIGEISGHFVFDTNDSYVYINFTKGNLSTFSVEGTAEFSVNNFRFKYGDGILLEVSKVITGGIHWRKGRSGNLTITVDDTFTDIDIDISFNVDEYTNFSVSGRFDIDINSQMSGTIWFDWDFNEGVSSKNLTIGGDLLGYNNVNINITDFEIQTNNFYLFVEKVFFNKTIYIIVNETGIHIESESTFELGDIYVEFEFEGGTWDLLTLDNAEFEIDGSISFSFKPEGSPYGFCVEVDGYFHIKATVIGNLGENSFEVNIKNFTFDGYMSFCAGWG